MKTYADYKQMKKKKKVCPKPYTLVKRKKKTWNVEKLEKHLYHYTLQ